MKFETPKTKKYYVIEMANSAENRPDYLQILDGGIVKWIEIRTGSNFIAQQEIALSQATQFDSEAKAKKAIQGIFGKKYKYRITCHYKYE